MPSARWRPSTPPLDIDLASGLCGLRPWSQIDQYRDDTREGSEMNEAPDEATAGPIDDVTDSGVFQTVLDGYDAVYDALPNSRVFTEIWGTNAYGADFPDDFAHIGFLTVDEGRHLLQLLRLGANDVLVDVACGAGGPGLWAAQQTGATLIGVDPSAAGLAAARRRAERVGLASRATFQQGTFEQTGLPDASADGAISIEAFQYAPDKRAALAELQRILRPGGRIGIVCFEVDPSKVAGLPVLGVDPHPDYAPVLAAAGFAVEAYEETPGWASRVYGTFETLVDAANALVADLGERAAAGVLAEATLTVQTRPYPRRVLLVAQRLD
jgi:SAM-dependent methyltransferase